MSKKRGISTVIATVLILLITVSAIALLASIIVPFTKDKLESSTECVTFIDSLKFDTDLSYNCVSANNTHYISIKGNYDKSLNLSSFAILFSNQNTTRTITVADNSNASEFFMLSGSSQLTIPKSGEIRTYKLTPQNKFDTIELYPLAASGRICDKSDELSLGVCIS